MLQEPFCLLNFLSFVCLSLCKSADIKAGKWHTIFNWGGSIEWLHEQNVLAVMDFFSALPFSWPPFVTSHWAQGEALKWKISQIHLRPLSIPLAEELWQSEFSTAAKGRWGQFHQIPYPHCIPFWSKVSHNPHQCLLGYCRGLPWKEEGRGGNPALQASSHSYSQRIYRPIISLKWMPIRAPNCSYIFPCPLGMVYWKAASNLRVEKDQPLQNKTHSKADFLKEQDYETATVLSPLLKPCNEDGNQNWQGSDGEEQKL